MEYVERVDAERAWLAAAGALVLAVVGGSIAFRESVYGNFVWHYFWGPVYADANGAVCAAWDGGARTLLYSQSACRAAAEPVAYPGYTLVSEVGYMLVLLLALGGVVLLLRRFRIGTDRSFFFALFPFMLFGGALRVVEDANDAVPAGVETTITYPLNALIISPVIYFTVFGLTLVAVVGAVWAAREGHAEGYQRPLFGAGTALLAVTVGYLSVLALTTDYVGFYPIITVLTFFLATAATALVWWLAETYAPSVNEGTGLIGAVVIWGHAVDGAANVIGIDWGAELGLPYGDLIPKHPVNRAVIDVTASVVPESITAVIGDAWPFFLLKLVAATGAVWLFNDEILEESPRYAILMLIAILAVGLGPGSRDMLRATFGV